MRPGGAGSGLLAGAALEPFQLWGGRRWAEARRGRSPEVPARIGSEDLFF